MSQRPARRRFERLVHEHHAEVYRAALRVLGETQAAEDATQQVFLALVEGRLDLRESRDERAVLRWWAVRTALAALRGERNRRHREEQHVMPQPDTDPAEAAAREDERGTLERLVADLPEGLRLAVRLRFEEGLSFARLGEALAVSEPVAHERVQRALERLRQRLRGCGLAAIAADLEPRLRQASPAPVPPGLAERLTALPSAATASGWGLAIAVACGGAVLTGGAWIALRPAPAELVTARPTSVLERAEGGRTEVPRTEARAAVDPSAAEASPTGDASVPAAAARLESAWVRGRVVDAGGDPVEGARVTAATSERRGKFPREVVQTASKRAGWFELELPALSSEATSWLLSAVHSGLTARREAPLRSTPGARIEAGELALGGVSDARPGPWALNLRALTSTGTPLDGVVVRVFPLATRADGALATAPMEAYGVTDGTGWVELLGDELGGKRITLDARSRGWQRAQLDLVLLGALTEQVILEPGLELRGRLVDSSGRPLDPERGAWGPDPQVFASAADSNQWFDAQHEPGGRFSIIGLSPEPHRVFLQSPTLSPICLEGVLPGGAELEIAVKRREEPLDIGPHCPEVHGVLRDARSGEPVPAQDDDVEAEWLPGDAKLDFERDVLPNLLWPRPRQTALFGEPPRPRADFHLVGLRPGRYAVAARVRGYAPALSDPIGLDPGALVAGLELRLEPPSRLEGRVLDVDGAALPGAWVLLTGDGPHSRGIVAALDRDVRETDGRPAGWSRGLVQADAQGHFTLEGLPPGLTFTLAAVHPRREPLLAPDCRPGADVVLQVEAKRRR